MDKCIPDAAIRRAWLNSTLTSAEAARSVGLTRVSLWLRAKKLNLPARPSGRREVIPGEVLASLWLANVRVADIAAFYRCPKASVSQSARRLGLPKRPKGKHHPISLEDYRQQLLGQIMARQTTAECAASRISISRVDAE